MNKKIIINNKFLLGILVYCFLILFGISAASAQIVPDNANNSVPQIDAAAEKIKKQVRKIGQGKDITVKTKNGRMVYGSITNIETDLVLINDVDQNNLVEIRYMEIAKVVKGYSNDRDINGNRIPVKKRNLGLILASTAIIIPVAIVLASLK